MTPERTERHPTQIANKEIQSIAAYIKELKAKKLFEINETSSTKDFIFLSLSIRNLGGPALPDNLNLKEMLDWKSRSSNQTWTKILNSVAETDRKKILLALGRIYWGNKSLRESGNLNLGYLRNLNLEQLLQVRRIGLPTAIFILFGLSNSESSFTNSSSPTLRPQDN
jgi:hypothetical protein